MLTEARLHTRFLLQQVDAILVALKLQPVKNPCNFVATNCAKIASSLLVRFFICNTSATKMVSSCCVKGALSVNKRGSPIFRECLLGTYAWPANSDDFRGLSCQSLYWCHSWQKPFSEVQPLKFGRLSKDDVDRRTRRLLKLRHLKISTNYSSNWEEDIETSPSCASLLTTGKRIISRRC